MNLANTSEQFFPLKIPVFCFPPPPTRLENKVQTCKHVTGRFKACKAPCTQIVTDLPYKISSEP